MAEDVPEPEAPRHGEDALPEGGGEPAAASGRDDAAAGGVEGDNRAGGDQPVAENAEAEGADNEPVAESTEAERADTQSVAETTEAAAEAQPPAEAGAGDAEVAEPAAGASEAEGAAANPAASAASAPRAPLRRPSRRTLVLAAALVAIVAVIVVDVVVIVKGAKKNIGPAARVVPAPVASAPPRASTAPPASAAALAPKAGDGGVFLDYDDSAQLHESAPEPHVTYRTVQEAANRTCSTKSVDGLSKQIIRQSRCFDPNAFVPVPRRPNLKTKSNVYLYLEAPARRHLLDVLDANRNKIMTINSALRTVAQQYVLQQWYRRRRCGITLAALPGQSNHETGLALDVAEAYKWKSAFKKQHFHWLGKVDGMHFDYKGPGAETGLHADVKAFQQLWNLNHPKDAIPDNGHYTPATEERLKRSPAAGFKHGPHCR